MSTVVGAWQQALAAEHRAVFAYGLIGPRLGGSDQALAVACSDAHEQLRDRMEAALVAVGAVPVQPEADYPDLYGATSVAAARRLAAAVESDCADAWRYAYFVAASTSNGPAAQLRTVAQTSLTASAVRATKWRVLLDPAHATVAFPGI